MDIIEQYLPSGDNCECGKVHNLGAVKVISGSGAINSVATAAVELGGKKPFIVCDKNTFRVAGEKVASVLRASDISHSIYVLQEDVIEPDELAVGSVVMHFDHSCDLIIGVGSGVINDISKILARTTKLPYIIVGTAPSMDGYASGTSSVVRDGFKISLNSKSADVIIGDTDILKNAPMKMLLSGLGDMVAKYVSILEWKLANVIVNEYYCERTASAVMTALKKCVDNAEGLLVRDESAVKAVFDGLVLSGAAMAYVGLSRPASGVEHYFSHTWDMRAIEFGYPCDTHGNQCAVGTLIAVKMYEKLKDYKIDAQRAIDYAQNFDYDAHAKFLTEFLGKGAESMISQEKVEKKYDKQKHLERLNVIVKNWDKIVEMISTLPSSVELEKLYDTLSMPKTLKDVGVDPSLEFDTFIATKDIRDKYVLSRLAWDLGIIDDFK